jgi:phage baseplate assembly protein W
MNIENGSKIDGNAHIRQSIATIITTPIGSRVMRRDFGCGVFELLDQPFTSLLKIQLQSAIVTALNHFEPRVRLSKVTVHGVNQQSGSNISKGQLTLSLEGMLVANNQFFQMANFTL